AADIALEKLMPGDFRAAADMKPKYSLLLDDDGGIIDDLMATRRGEDFYVVVNGATKYGDIAVMENRLPGDVVIDHMKEQALLAPARSRTAALRSRPRYEDHAGHGGTHLRHQQAPTGGGRLPRCDADPRRAGERPAAKARRFRCRWPPAGPRRRTRARRRRE